ncbi:MAG: mannose-1-phosphate guanylyltransferase, partial [Bacteroidota bacterium]
MAGGVGSRFWPASREDLPKQFLDILGVGRSLIQLTYDRAIQIVPKENVLIATNKKYKNLVNEHLPEISDNQILLEPSRNNTAPCIAYLALKIANQNPNATFAVWPSDHVILKEAEFIKKINLAFDYATMSDALVTLGIQPTRPDTGYGYIEVNHKDGAQGIEKVVQFKEKPDLETAKEYLNAGNYFWNAGIFIWSVKSVLSAFEKNAPQIIEVLGEDKSKYNTLEEQAYIDQVYPNTQKISVDYALLEKSNNVFTIPADIGWSDLGTWNSLHAYLDKDQQQNVFQGT